MASLGYSNGKGNLNSEIYFIETYKLEGKKYPQKRVVKRCGRLGELLEQDPNILEKLKKEAHEWGKKTGFNDNQAIALSIIERETSKQKEGKSSKLVHKNYSWIILEALYRELGIEQGVKKYCKENKIKLDVNKVLKLATFMRIIDPGSKLALVKSQNNLLGTWDLTHNDVYRSLDHIADLKDVIEDCMGKGIDKYIGRSRSTFYYDVTNYFFASDVEDPDLIDYCTGEILKPGLRKHGYSKENRRKPIVQFGMFLDSNALPISFSLFPGNCSDVSTYSEAMKQIRNRYDVKRIVIVADKAMNCNKNIEYNLDNGYGWIFSTKIRGNRGVSKQLQEMAVSDDGWQINSDGSFAMKTFLRQRNVNKNKAVTEKVVVTWSEKYSSREQNRRDSIIKKVEVAIDYGYISTMIKKNIAKYANATIKDIQGNDLKGEIEFKLNEDVIKHERQFDGLNVLVTSELNMEEKTVIEHYSSLWKIENSFKILKTGLESRPVYVRTEKHILAHFVVCFLAMSFIRIIKHLTNDKHDFVDIIKGLTEMKASYDKHNIWKLNIDAQSMELLKDLKLTHPHYIVKDEMIYVKEEKLYSNYRSLLGTR